MKSKLVLTGLGLIALGALFVRGPTIFHRLHRIVESGLGSMDALQERQTSEARVELKKAKTDADKCDPLSQIAKFDVDHGNLAEARRYANELLAIAPKIRPKDYDKADNIYQHDVDGNQLHTDYGLAIFYGNLVLGRLALREHRLEDAKAYLLKAGMTPGACTLNSFGPNMTLAEDLLDAKQSNTVLQFFGECRRFWQDNKLDSWIEEVKSGGVPDFGANLYY